MSMSMHIAMLIVNGTVLHATTSTKLPTCCGFRTILRLSPNELVFQNAEKEKATELPLIKYQHKKKDGDEAGDPMEKEQLFGYPFALLSRRTAMEAAGMSTALPSLSKEQKKAEKDKKKALVNAKHLLR